MKLEQIAAKLRGRPDMLRMRYEIYAAAKQWEGAAEIALAISELVERSLRMRAHGICSP
jgi:hypothetical protein